MTLKDDLIIVIFGASGDLASRKLIPSIYNLHQQKLLPGNFAVLGVGRKIYDDNSFRAKITEALIVTNDKVDNDFLRMLYYTSIDTSSKDDYKKLSIRLEKLDKEINAGQNVIFYLATPPQIYETITENLSYQGLNHAKNKEGFRRIIIEKPFGYDLESAKKLNAKLQTFFDEKQIYRIDHYLGKETVQNIMVTRFSNSFFEPLWNRNYIDHIQITAAEHIGIENRGGYFDKSGSLRDMVQNHLLLLTSMVAMEPPALADPTSIRNEIVKVFQSLRPMTHENIRHDVIRGQYTTSTIDNEHVLAYRDEEGVEAGSKTETYTALKFYIDNWRWKDIPFFIRTGKRLPARVTEIVVHFKATPHHLFCYEVTHKRSVNKLVLRIQPDEGILLTFGMKVPGAGYKLQDVNMDFHYSDISDKALPGAYARLLVDAMNGDPTLYARGDAIEATWRFITPILQAWKEHDEWPVYGYPAGSWGPKEAEMLTRETGNGWRNPCKNLTNSDKYCEL